MIDGFYVIYYTGHGGSAFAMLIINAGKIVGADAVGGTLEGKYVPDVESHVFNGTLTMNVPAGVALATGTPPSPTPYSFTFEFSLPENLGGSSPITIETPTGPLNVVFRKLRNLD
jgi:hypothetical protein